MYISKLILRNFRSFGPEATVIKLSKLNALIGSNSSGKTAALQALLRMFGVNQKDRQLQRSDFHIPKGMSPEALSESDLFIEAVIEFPELQDDNVHANATVPPVFNQMVIRNEGEAPYLRVRLIGKWSNGLTLEGEIEQRLVFVTVSEGIAEDESRYVAMQSHDRSLIQMLYVPALRDPSSQLKNVSGTLLSRMLKAINWPQEMNTRVKEEMEAIENLFARVPGVQLVKETIQNQWNNYHQDVRYTKADLLFNGADLESVLKKVELQFSPTEVDKNYSVDQLGDGLRSLFYISLVSSLLELEYKAKVQASQTSGVADIIMRSPSLTILAVEEPENHVAPQLLGKIVANLKKISDQPNAQVLITSHTPTIVKRIPPESISYLRIDKGTHCTIVRPIELPEGDVAAYKYVKGAVQTYPELYFARLVVLGEGESEELVLPRVINALGDSLDTSGICFVPLGGRHVNHLWKLLQALNIPYVTLLDLDRERSGGGWGRVHYVISQLLALGHRKEELLKLSNDQVMTDDEFDEMKHWVVDIVNLDAWLQHLENENVFFSYPLDLDFMMLNRYQDEYKGTAPANGGPRVPKDAVKLKERIDKDIRATLKAEGGNGSTYTTEETSLMTWYNYLFLGRGKPSTHMLALNDISDETLLEKLPQPLFRLFNKIQEQLVSDPYSVLSQSLEVE